MSHELAITLLKFLNVIFCFIIIALSLWHNAKIKVHSNTFIALSIGLLILLIIQTVFVSLYEVIGVFLLLIIVLVSMRDKYKLKPVQQTLHNSNNIDDLINQAKEQERSRIYANLHDDVGAKLLELIYTVKDDESKDLAKQVLSDIRQAVANTVNIQCTVQQLVMEILDEAKMRLNSAHVNLKTIKQINNPNHNLALNVPIVISKICREVITNIIKHAKASLVEINFVSTDKILTIKLSDDGCGFSKNNQSGKGLKTINKRAQSISSMVEWHSDKNKGTQFKLTYTYGNF